MLRGGFPGSSLGYGFGATGMTPADRSGSVGFSPGVTHATRRDWRPLRRVFGLRPAYVCDSGLKGRFPVAPGNARGTRIKAHKAVPEFTANAFADHHRRFRLASLCEPKTMNPLRCSGGMPSTTPHFAGHDKALARAFLTRGTKVDWGRGGDLLRLKKAVFCWGCGCVACPG